MKGTLVNSGAVVFLLNYVIGWLLKMNIITITRQLHQVIFSVLLLNLTCLLFYVSFHDANSFLLITSLFFLVMLPFGKKGGIYHITLSSAAILTFSVFFVIELQL